MTGTTAEIRAYWSRLAPLGCIACSQDAEIAHCHGGSMQDLGYTKTKGKKQPWMDWLVLPICPTHHRWAPFSLDKSVTAFESRFGRQVDWLDVMVIRLGVDVWKKMRAAHPNAWLPSDQQIDYRRAP